MNGRVIAAINSGAALKKALKTNVKMIFDLAPDIETIAERSRLCAEHSKIYFVHIDLAEGIGKDSAGLKYIKDRGADGIISTKAALIKAAKELGLKTVQRVFMIDSQSIKSAQASLKIHPDIIEIMPGLIPSVISEIADFSDIPVIAGGLIRYDDDVVRAIKAGAAAVSTTKSELWK